MSRNHLAFALGLLGWIGISAPGRAAEKPITGEDRAHWAFTAPRRPVVPAVREGGLVRNPIDAFVLANLDREGLRPAPEAERATLIRRLTYDLIGLPPTPAEVAGFVADPAPDAYERVVDRLLASPHHGERWAQHWLDLARYADTDGFEFDAARPDAWRYRDWVVGAINRDLPYDAFVRLQLAGDEAEPDDSPAFIATGFARCYPDMVDLNDQGLRRQNALNDITETTGLAFLGLTVGCARCHDHKSDPIRQTDFYRLQAFFTPARFRDDYPIASRVDRLRQTRQRGFRRLETAILQATLIGLEAPTRAHLAPGPPAGLDDGSAAAFKKPAAERSPEEIALVFAALTKDRRIKPEALTGALDPITNALRRVLVGHLDRLRALDSRPLPQARGIDEAGPDSPPTFVLKRGEYGARGEAVPPAFPVVLVPDETTALARVEPSRRSSGRRLALADWLTRADHPLTARVIVNRLWQHHFGRGIVATPSDFGVLGEPPDHPELLDWLATELPRRGWSLKAIHRLIVTSAAYRRSSLSDPAGRQADPENRLLWRQTRRRLDGEAIRDALLAVSGRLNRAIGGPPVFPELPAELAGLGGKGKGALWPVSLDPGDRDRRSLYVFIRRNLRYPFFEAFDRPDTNASCARREVTTIAPQALTLLNGQIAREAAQAFADRVRREAGPEPQAEINHAYLVAFARPPDAHERNLALAFLQRDPSLARLCLALLNLNEFVAID